MKKYFYTGSYTFESEYGIHLCSLDSESGELKIEKRFSDIESPSYLAINRANDRLYALSERDGSGMITSYIIKDDGGLSKLNCVFVSGGQLCHIALNFDESIVAVAGYESGTVDLFELNGDGSVGKNIFSEKHTGKGAIEGRQDCPHCHFVFFPENRKDTFYVTDLGNDTLYRYRIENGNVGEVSRLAFPAGDGPRHIVQSRVDKNIIYLVCEISFKIHTIRMYDLYDEIIDTVSTVEDGADYFGGAAAIRISEDNKYLYVSNRVITPQNGFDSIAGFELDESLLAKNKNIFKAGNRMPRDFCLFDDILVVASQDDFCVKSFRIDKKTGLIKENLSEININKPVCILPYSKGVK